MSDCYKPVPGLQGTGLGLRRDLLDELERGVPEAIDFFEVAPENWIGIGGRLGRRFAALAEQRPVVLHGLSLSIGGPDPLDTDLVRRIGAFMQRHDCPLYTEHLSYCAADGHLYDLMPMPFTAEAVRHVAERIGVVQDILGRRIAMEHVSYYTPLGGELSELEFLLAVLDEADCDLHLDVNNAFVNAVNHGYDARAFLDALPAERIVYCHVAGHYVEAEDLLVDTHGAPVIDPVWELLDHAYARFGTMPTLLERDFNIPPLAELLDELHTIRDIRARHERVSRVAHG